MDATFTESDEGKKVVHDGKTVGRVLEVRGGTAYVDPNPTLASTLKARLGWGDTTDEAETYALDDSMVEQIQDEAVHIRNGT